MKYTKYTSLFSCPAPRTARPYFSTPVRQPILFKMRCFGAFVFATLFLESVLSWYPQDIAPSKFARNYVRTCSLQSQNMIVPVSSLFSVYSILNTSRDEDAVQSTQRMIDNMAECEGCLYTGWTKLGPHIFLHNLFSSGITAKAHLEDMRPRLMNLRQGGHITLTKLSLHGNAAELVRVKDVSTSISQDSISPATLMFRPENSIFFQNPEEIHGPPTSLYPYPKVNLNSEFGEQKEIDSNIDCTANEINEGVHKKNKGMSQKDSTAFDSVVTEAVVAEGVNITTYFEIFNWGSAKKNFAEVIENSINEKSCKYQSWTRSRDLLVVHETFDTAGDVASHWARCGVLYEAMFASKAAFLNRIEVHSAEVEAAEEIAKHSDLLNFARFDRLESEIVGAVFARRVESEFAAAHRLLLYRMADAERDNGHLDIEDGNKYPRSVPEPVESPIPSSSWATRGHRVHIGRINPVE